MGNRSRRDYRKPLRSSDPAEEYNPFATPGIAPEDMSAYSPGGEYQLRGRTLRSLRATRFGRLFTRFYIGALAVIALIGLLVKVL